VQYEYRHLYAKGDFWVVYFTFPSWQPSNTFSRKTPSTLKFSGGEESKEAREAAKKAARQPVSKAVQETKDKWEKLDQQHTNPPKELPLIVNKASILLELKRNTIGVMKVIPILDGRDQLNTCYSGLA
jgi:hypothetical protein